MIFPPAQRGTPPPPPPVPVITVPEGAAAVEQGAMGTGPAPEMAASFDGLGVGFTGPQGTATTRNPSDNSLAVGPDHIFQIVNSRMAIFTKKGRKYGETGRVLYGPVITNTIFKGFGGSCEQRNSGDAVVRYDQLANRWLVVVPVFQRGDARPDQPAEPKDGEIVQSVPGRRDQPGPAAPLFVPAFASASADASARQAAPPAASADASARQAAPPASARQAGPRPTGPYSMCYAVSTTSDPLGPYYRYEFLRALFPDYPRPAVWPDGYYVPSSTGDDVIQKHTCVVEREKMLQGEPAREICAIVDGVNFLNNADLDGTRLPPAGAPNIVLAAGGTQLKKVFEDAAIFAWQFHVDWKTPSKTSLTGPQAIAVAPYHYLCDGQLSSCVPQPDTERRLDAQGDKIMARLVYRRIGTVESVVAVHSVNTSKGGGGVRWYELRVGADRTLRVHQQGTFAPDGFFRWMASPAIDKLGNIGIGYSFGGTPHYAGQRFAGRLANDPRGALSTREAVLVDGEAAQTNTLRWEDYAQTAIDPSDDCTIWYVGDYMKKDMASYSTRIGAFRLAGCR